MKDEKPRIRVTLLSVSGRLFFTENVLPIIKGVNKDTPRDIKYLKKLNEFCFDTYGPFL